MSTNLIISLYSLKNNRAIHRTTCRGGRLLARYVKVAEIYITDAISNVEELEGDYREEARLKLLYCVLVRELFDNRENTEKGEFSYTVRTLITQLQTKQGD